MNFNTNQDADATVGDQTATSGKEVRQLSAGELRTENKGGSATSGAPGYDWLGVGDPFARRSSLGRSPPRSRKGSASSVGSGNSSSSKRRRAEDDDEVEAGWGGPKRYAKEATGRC
nr:unnamed protein product [Callosobruchus chinensis]